MALPPKSFRGTGRHVRALPVIHQEAALDECSYFVHIASGHPFDLPFSVELWDENDRRVEELIALTADYGVARAAYDEAIRKRPGRIVTLRQKTRILADSRRQTRLGSTSATTAVTKMMGSQSRRLFTHGKERGNFFLATWRSLWTAPRLGRGL